MGAGHSQNQDACDDWAFLVNSLVVACHHDPASVGVEMFLELHLILFDGMLKMIVMFIK